MAKDNITKEVEIMDLGLWLPKQKILVFSDFHIGFEEALNKSGVMIPRHQLSDTLERLKKIFSLLGEKPSKIIINGDLKHEFGTVNREDFFGVRDLLNLLAKNCKEIVIIKVNHDTILNYTKKSKIKIASDLLIDDILFVHGDEFVENLNSAEAKLIVIGHAHPTLKLTDNVISEKVKCFLKGSWKNKTIIALPSFNLVTEGTDAISEYGFSPYLDNMKNTEAWAIPEFNKVLYFGKLKDLPRAVVN